jgi:hypothetical protein
MPNWLIGLIIIIGLVEVFVGSVLWGWNKILDERTERLDKEEAS